MADRVTHGKESAGSEPRNKKEEWRQREQVPDRNEDDVAEDTGGYDPCTSCRGL